MNTNNTKTTKNKQQQTTHAQHKQKKTGGGITRPEQHTHKQKLKKI